MDKAVDPKLIQQLIEQTKRRTDWGEDDATRLAARIFEARMKDVESYQPGEVLEDWDLQVQTEIHTAVRVAALFHSWAKKMSADLRDDVKPIDGSPLDTPDPQTLNAEPVGTPLSAESAGG